MTANNREGLCKGRTRFYPPVCDRAGTIERDGKLYCWQHDPERLRQEAMERAKADREASEKRMAQWDREDKRKERLKNAGIPTLTDEELDLVAEFGGVSALIKYRLEHEG